MGYFTCFYAKSLRFDRYFTFIMHFNFSATATLQVLSSHMWLVATVLVQA